MPSKNLKICSLGANFSNTKPNKPVTNANSLENERSDHMIAPPVLNF